MPACGNDAARSWTAARVARSSARTEASASRRAPASVRAVSGSDMARSAGDRVDGDRHAVGDHVEHRGARAGARDDLTQLLRRRVALDAERDADVLEAVADLVGDAEAAADVHVALERRLDARQPHAARRGD